MDLENELSELTALEWGKLLKHVRQYMDYSQLEVSELLNVGSTTYQKWEQGRRKPRPVYRRKIREVFNDAFSALDISKEKSGMSVSKHQETMTTDVAIVTPLLPQSLEFRENIVIAAPSLKFYELQAFMMNDLTMCLQSLAFAPYNGYQDMHIRMVQTLKDFDAMNTGNKSYQITRREALARLAALPIATLHLNTSNQPIQTGQYTAILAHCAAGIEACWQLSKSNIASDLARAFEGVETYLPLLEEIMKDSSRYRQEALVLAGQCSLLKTMLGWECKSRTEATRYAKQALSYSKETVDISLQLSAYSKLAWAYYFDKKHGLALTTAMEAQATLEREGKNTTIPACIRGGTYSTLALMQARNGKACDIALGKAIDIDPGDTMHSFMQFTRADLPLEIGMIYYYQGNQAKAMQSFEKNIDSTTLTLKNTATEQGNGRYLETINAMALATIKGKDHDMEKAIRLWKVGMQETKIQHNEWGFNEALATYELMDVYWFGEKRILELRDLTDHW